MSHQKPPSRASFQTALAAIAKPAPLSLLAERVGIPEADLPEFILKAFNDAIAESFDDDHDAFLAELIGMDLATIGLILGHAIKASGYEISRPATVHHSPDGWQSISGGPYAAQAATDEGARNAYAANLKKLGMTPERDAEYRSWLERITTWPTMPTPADITNIVAVHLPEPDENGEWHSEDWAVWVTRSGDVSARLSSRFAMAPATTGARARAFAAALLAAANAAEATE